MHDPKDERYPYRHHGPAVHGSKLHDYLISEHSFLEDFVAKQEPLGAEFEKAWSENVEELYEE